MADAATITLSPQAQVLLDATQYFATDAYKEAVAKMTACREAAAPEDRQMFDNMVMVLTAQPQLVQGALSKALTASMADTAAPAPPANTGA